MHTEFNARSFIDQASAVYATSPLPPREALIEELETLPAVFSTDREEDRIYKKVLLAGLEWLREGEGKIAFYHQTPDDYSHNEVADALDILLNQTALDAGLEKNFYERLAREKAETARAMQDVARELPEMKRLEGPSGQKSVRPDPLNNSEFIANIFDMNLGCVRDRVLRTVGFISECGWRVFINDVQEAKKVNFGQDENEASFDVIDSIYAEDAFVKDVEKDALSLLGSNKLLFAKPKNLIYREPVYDHSKSFSEMFDVLLKPKRRTYYLQGIIAQPKF